MARTAGSNLDDTTKQRIRQLLAMDIPVGVVAARMNLSYMTVRKFKKCQS